MDATTHAGCLVGIEAHSVRVEVQLGRGLPGFDLIGLPDRGVRESRVRVRAALAHLGYRLPPRHLVVNLAPGDLKKDGTAYDLAIAIGVLAACGLLEAPRLSHTLLIGELSLTGELRPVPGALAHLLGAQRAGLRAAVLPQAQGNIAALASGLEVCTASHLQEVIDWLQGSHGQPASPATVADACQPPIRCDDLADVRGQATARRALEIAAAGQHHLLLVGPPGCGKTMLAQRLPGILPPLGDGEALEVATIADVHQPDSPAVRRILSHRQPPFRAPHHAVSTNALVGGGNPARLGEVTLAHGGVLFLDELPEFRSDAIESLRTVLEQGEVRLQRTQYRLQLPARMRVVAAMNPCPCGYEGDRERLCRCTPDRVARYRARVSGPLLDRFDLHVQLPRLAGGVMRQAPPGESSLVVRQRVIAAHERRHARLAHSAQSNGGPMEGEGLQALCKQSQREALALLDQAAERLGVSGRGYVKVLRVARTIADLAGEERIDASHVAEAVQYRALDQPSVC